MDKAYYKEYYHLERGHWWFLARQEILRSLVGKYLPVKEGFSPRILNVGVATGATSRMLEEFGEVTSIEYDSDCCRFLREELNMEVIEGSVTDLPFAEQSFDLVCAFDVVEHVEDDQVAMNELYRVSRKGGVLIVTVPAFMSLWSEHDVVNHHFRRYTSPQLLKLGEEWKAELIQRSYFNAFLFFPIWSFRNLKRIFSSSGKAGKKADSDFRYNGPGGSNRILYRVFRAELPFLSAGFRFPFGVSLLAIWKKFA